MRTYNRKEVFLQKLRFAKPFSSKILQRKNVMVKDPVSGLACETVVTSYIDEPLVDSHLKSSDFDLDVQLRNDVKLQECPSYLSPSSPEEYELLLQNHVNVLDRLSNLNVSNNQVQEPEVVESSKTE